MRIEVDKSYSANNEDWVLVLLYLTKEEIKNHGLVEINKSGKDTYCDYISFPPSGEGAQDDEVLVAGYGGYWSELGVDRRDGYSTKTIHYYYSADANDEWLQDELMQVLYDAVPAFFLDEVDPIKEEKDGEFAVYWQSSRGFANEGTYYYGKESDIAESYPDATHIASYATLEDARRAAERESANVGDNATENYTSAEEV